MEVETNIISAKCIVVRHPEQSYAIFCYTSKGSLFIDSDWGFYGHRWGCYDGTFEKFIASIDEEYFINKLEINHFNETGKKIVKRRKEALTILFREFKNVIKANL